MNPPTTIRELKKRLKGWDVGKSENSGRLCLICMPSIGQSFFSITYVGSLAYKRAIIQGAYAAARAIEGKK